MWVIMFGATWELSTALSIDLLVGMLLKYKGLL